MELNNREHLKQLREKIAQALQPMADDLGLGVEATSMVFEPDGTKCTVKVEIKKLFSADEENALAAREFARWAPLFRVPPDAFGKEITSRGVKYTLFKLEPGRPKFPVVAKRVPDGTLFKFKADALKPFEKPEAI